MNASELEHVRLKLTAADIRLQELYRECGEDLRRIHLENARLYLRWSGEYVDQAITLQRKADEVARKKARAAR